MTLDDIYAQLPAMQCRGKCQESCGSIGVTASERQRIEERHGIQLPRAAVFDEHCPALSQFGTCTVYADRPLVCRIWGLVESMACPWGCMPEGGWLDEAKGHALMASAIRLDGAS